MSHQWDKIVKKVNEQLETIETGISRRDWKTLIFVIIMLFILLKVKWDWNMQKKKVVAGEWGDYYMRRNNSSSEDMTVLYKCTSG